MTTLNSDEFSSLMGRDAPKHGQYMTVWGHSFTWTSSHPTVQDVRRMLFSYDKLANDALDRLDRHLPAGTKEAKCPHDGVGKEEGKKKKDLYSLLQEHAANDEVLGELWHNVSTVPDWVDWEQIARGQEVVYQFSGQIVLGLLFKSLVGGMGAWRVVETLARTGGFGIQVTRRRLLETFQHFLDVVEDVDAVRPGGKGFVSSVRVRLLHASVRRRLMKLEGERPGYFDMEGWGVPINDLHCIGTVCVYSAALIWMALPRQGIFLSERQKADYLALWRWIGHLLGTPVDWMATPSRAKAMMESVMVSEVEPSPNSRILANNILTAETGVPPLFARREYLAALAYRLNGRHLAGALGIERPGLYWRGLGWVQCVVLMGVGYAYPWMSEKQKRRKHERFITFGHKMITSHKNGGTGKSTTFEFQYIPQLGKMTELAPTKVKKAVAGAKSFGGAHLKMMLSTLFIGLLAVISSPYWLSTGDSTGRHLGQVWETGTHESSSWKLWQTSSIVDR